MALSVRNATFDCGDPARLARFWATVLGYTALDHEGYSFATPEGWQPGTGVVRLLFQAVPEDKIVKNRLHFDLTADDMAAEVKRLNALGGRPLEVVEEHGLRWTVMADPEGNEFCVVQSPD